jgi:hypothetical protein
MSFSYAQAMILSIGLSLISFIGLSFVSFVGLIGHIIGLIGLNGFSNR